MKSLVDRIRPGRSVKPNGYYHVIALNAITEKDDKKFLAVAIGEYPNHKDGPHVVSREDCEAMAEQIRASKLDVLVDYGHESRWNAAAIAAGWCDKDSVEVREDGLYLALPVWTRKAEEHIRNGEYMGLSSCYVLNTFDKYNKPIKAKLLSLALTNVPYMETEVDHLPDFANAKTQEELEMTWTDQERQMLIAKYGLNADADEETIKKAILNAEIPKPKADAPSPTENADKTNAAGDEIATLKQTVAELTAAVAALTAANADALKARAAALVDEAIRLKKILPKQRDTYLAAANADWEKTKAELDSIPEGAVIQALEKPKDGKPAVNTIQEAAEFFKSRGRVPIATN